MAENLLAFMAENAEQTETIEYVASKRFKQDNEPIKWRIKPITSTKDAELRKSCTKRVPVNGKRGQFTKDTDFDEYLAKIAVACTEYPNLNDANLQDSYKVMGAENLLRTMLLPGEYADYLAKVQEVCGFDTMDELVEEAKN